MACGDVWGSWALLCSSCKWSPSAGRVYSGRGHSTLQTSLQDWLSEMLTWLVVVSISLMFLWGISL